MIKSMTAYASASEVQKELSLDLTVRSYNSRHLDFNIYLPEACQPFEEKVKKIMGQHHNRGRIEIRISLTDASQDQVLFEVDAVRAKAYARALAELQGLVNPNQGQNSEILLETVLGGKQMILAAKQQVDTEALEKLIENGVTKAALELDRMRCREGENLFSDLWSRLTWIEDQMDAVETLARQIPEVYKKKLEDRLAALTGEGDQVDPMRLAQEVAILADKSDVSEEIVRVHSHIKLFREIMNDPQSQGRKMNFLLQEFNREFNTIGSKSGSPELSHLVVELKSELEKIREQVQNIE